MQIINLTFILLRAAARFSLPVKYVILQYPDVQDVAVIGIPDDEFGEQVKAFCEPVPGKTIDENALLAFCKNNLASYKCPKTIEMVTELPRNTMGKILKRELRDPYWQDKERSI